MQEQSKRVKFLRIHLDALVGLLCTESIVPDLANGRLAIWTVHFPGLPPDAHIERVQYSFLHHSWEMVLSHPSWPEVGVDEAPATIESVDRLVVLVDRYVKSRDDESAHNKSLL